MPERGIIRRALLDIDLAAIDRPVQALIAVRIRPPSRRTIEAFRNWVSQLPGTIGVFVVSGSGSGSGSEDFLISLAVPDSNSLHAFVIDKLTERPEVADVRTSVVYEHLRNHAITPVPPAPARTDASTPRPRHPPQPKTSSDKDPRRHRDLAPQRPSARHEGGSGTDAAGYFT